MVSSPKTPPKGSRRHAIMVTCYRDKSRACAKVVPADKAQPIFNNSTSWLQSITSRLPTCASALEINYLHNRD